MASLAESRCDDVQAAELSAGEVSEFCNLVGLAPRQLMAARTSVTEHFGLGPRGAWVIGLVNNGLDTPTALTRALHIQRSLVTAELAPLLDAGLLESRRDAEDRRKSRLSLTDKGHRVEKELRAEIEQLVRGRLAGFERKDLLCFLEMLRAFAGGPGRFADRV